jgi:hypothetical protein
MFMIVDPEIHPHWDAISEALDVLALAVASEDAHANHRHLRAEQRLEISLNLFLLQVRHMALPSSRAGSQFGGN